jgi:excisionase family DNA binding protein
MAKKLSKLMTVDEVAAYLRVNPMTVYRLVNRGELPGVKVGDLWRFEERDIEAWLKRQKRATKRKR